MASAPAASRIGGAITGSSARNALVVVVVAVLLSITAFANRLPVMFPDTIGYNRAGEASFSALGRMFDSHDAAPVAHRAIAAATAGPTNDTVSGARSPYYGVVLALTNRIGGVWFSAFLQAIFAAAALLLALRRFGLTRAMSGWIAGAGAGLAGLGFFAVTLVPDIFLGPVIVAAAVLLTARNLPRGERWFWVAALLGGMLFHRGFVAVAVIIAIGVLPWHRARWLNRRGLIAVATCCGIAAGGHLAVGVATEKLLHQPMLTPPFVLARMADSPVLLAYLDETCPQKDYDLCAYRARLPMQPNAFLWWHGPTGLYADIGATAQQRLNAEANAIVVGAVAARPVAAVAEAVRLSIHQMIDAGMTDFAMKIPRQASIDPSIASSMDAYYDSGIVRGDFGLDALSAWTRAIYVVALLAAAAGAAGLIIARRQGAALDARLIAAVAIVVGAVTANAVISATLSGVNDRYQGRVAWLVVLAAVILCRHAFAALAQVSRSRVTDGATSPI